MKILLISYHYPPDRAVGGQRARKVADSLRAAGHDVRVIAAEGASGDAPDDDRVQRIIPLPSSRDVYAALRRRYGKSADNNADPEASGGDRAASSSTPPTPFWKRWIFSLIWLPDDRQGFIAPAVRQALRQSAWRPDLIYTTAPPFSGHLAGLFLKVLTGAAWAAEFRDPWTANPWKPAYMRSAFSDWFERRLEWLCVETADLLVAVSEGIADRLKEAGTTTPIRVIRNGIDDLRSAEGVAAARSGSPFEIMYAGSFYHTRDPFPFLEAVVQVIRSKSLNPSDLQVIFIGSTDAYEGQSVGDFLRQADLDEYVQIEGWVDPAESLARIRAADALLLLALDQPDQVPNKVYEYLGVRRPILAVVDEDGESARMLKRAGGHHIVPVNDAARIKKVLEDLLDQGRSGPVGDPAVLAEWTTTAQMAGLSPALEAVAEGRADSSSYSSP